MVVDKRYSVVFCDIDGTLKDLAIESTNALIRVIRKMGIDDLSFRVRLILCVNRVNMYLVKTGLLPTNKFMQNVLLFIYSLLLLKKYNTFRSEYLKEYSDEHMFFSTAGEMLRTLSNNGTKLYLVTKNKQNEHIIDTRSNQIKYTKILSYVYELVVGRSKVTKYYIYKELIEQEKLLKENVVIVGDNFWDDILPALILGVDYEWCDMYNCKLKKVAIKILKAVTKKK